MGGGIAWRKDQLDYKNTPANAPAAILAARLFQRFGDAEDLAWAQKIFAWNKAVLRDPGDGFIWEGSNRLGDQQIDKDWQFTYCQGVYLGASLELFACTADQSYLMDARQTAEPVVIRLCDPGAALCYWRRMHDLQTTRMNLNRKGGEIAINVSEFIVINEIHFIREGDVWCETSSKSDSKMAGGKPRDSSHGDSMGRRSTCCCFYHIQC
ncbi:hypothetical protein GCM10008018_38560 [Paenibacillus marchantiophytorum]|uniref:Uncharacterized protein n=2 Tax=Paenibacillus marchantiophytorum TaxID=1619310 RepID=A0ABQ1EW63_9BACL|nr:hypothetical protein GCM10008018_38560 [Paenibacillus marchantiophytorum]